MHLQFFDEVTGGNLDNKSTYWKISPSAVTNSTSLSRSSIGTRLLYSEAVLELSYIFFIWFQGAKRLLVKFTDFQNML